MLPNMTPNRIADRRALLKQLDDERHRLDAAGIDKWDHTYQSAFGLLTDEKARAAFDLTQESQRTRSSYGRSTFGQGWLVVVVVLSSCFDVVAFGVFIYPPLVYFTLLPFTARGPRLGRRERWG